TSFSRDPQIDSSWLTIVSAVRPALARLEAFQFDAVVKTSIADGTIKTARWKPLIAATNQPGDPWLTGTKPLADDKFIPPAKLVCMYGTQEGIDKALNRSPVAIGLLDSWTEFAPADESHISVAVRFDAPKARAPQAILLAVPPNEAPEDAM